MRKLVILAAMAFFISAMPASAKCSKQSQAAYDHCMKTQDPKSSGAKAQCAKVAHSAEDKS